MLRNGGSKFISMGLKCGASCIPRIGVPSLTYSIKSMIAQAVSKNSRNGRRGAGNASSKIQGKKKLSKFKMFIRNKKKNLRQRKLIKWKLVMKNAHLVTPSRFQIIDESDLSPTFRLRSMPMGSTPTANQKVHQKEASSKSKTTSNPKPPPTANSVSPFREIAGIPKPLLDILASTYKFTKLFEVQRLGIPSILKNCPTILAAETGTGKTLAYLIPILTKLKISENQNALLLRGKVSQKEIIIGPKALIVAPTRELALQIIAVVKVLAKQYRLRSGIILPGYTKVHFISFYSLLEGFVEMYSFPSWGLAFWNGHSCHAPICFFVHGEEQIALLARNNQSSDTIPIAHVKKRAPAYYD